MSKTSEKTLSIENTSRFWFKRVWNFLISENMHFLVIFRYFQISFALKYLCVDQVCVFLGGVFLTSGCSFLQWHRLSSLHVWFDQKLVRLIALMIPVNFLINKTWNFLISENVYFLVIFRYLQIWFARSRKIKSKLRRMVVFVQIQPLFKRL